MSGGGGIPDPARTDPGAVSADPGGKNRHHKTHILILCCVAVMAVAIGIGAYYSIRHI